MPPQARILDMLLGMMKTQAIHEAARLNLAELVKDGPRSVTELAEETQTHPVSLLRLLRALEGLGLFTEVEAGRYGQTEISHFLRPGVPGSMYDDSARTAAAYRHPVRCTLSHRRRARADCRF
jgi:Dimerisation domain